MHVGFLSGFRLLPVERASRTVRDPTLGDAAGGVLKAV
jgi:hypothetical protein